VGKALNIAQVSRACQGLPAPADNGVGAPARACGTAWRPVYGQSLNQTPLSLEQPRPTGYRRRQMRVC
jgi:hypothetical protein